VQETINCYLQPGRLGCKLANTAFSVSRRFKTKLSAPLKFILNGYRVWTCLFIFAQYHFYKKVQPSLYNPGQTLRVPRCWTSQISRHSAHEGGKVGKPTHRPTLPPGNIHDTDFCYRLSRYQGNSAAGRIMSMKNTSDTIENRTRDHPTCSAMLQTTALPRTPTVRKKCTKYPVTYRYLEVTKCSCSLSKTKYDILTSACFFNY
jgi:hypothetical protein